MLKVAIIGGGASGFFLGACLAPSLSVHIFEKSKIPLQKVRISGGGRCNVTHACFDPNVLIDFYPRGGKELRSVFHRFMCGDTMQWFDEKGVNLKIEEDGRVFPVSNNSQDIIDVLIKENIKKKTKVHLQESVKNVYNKDKGFTVETSLGTYDFDVVVMAGGSSRQLWKLIQKLGHTVIEPVASLFSFNCKERFLKNLPGTIIKNAEIKIIDSSFSNVGDLLITHWGVSGPAALVLSAMAARELAERKYQFQIQINFIEMNQQKAVEVLKKYKNLHAQQSVGKGIPFNLTKKFWKELLIELKIKERKNYAAISSSEMESIANFLCHRKFKIEGKSTHKDEFVTAGGVDLKEIDFKNMQSKIMPRLFFLGEILNIDAVTGGFNFQACWSEAFILAEYLNEL